MNTKIQRIVVSLAVAGLIPVAQADDNMRKEIDALKKQNAEIMERLDATVSAMESRSGGGSSQTRIGGYGELHYNNLENKANGSKKDEVDFHRFVLFFGHDFSDKIRFHSELEVEHAYTTDTADGSGPGAVELEQAYVEFDLSDTQQARAGVFLVPVGFINETHEPPTFYGVERNPVESNIIPTTWWEAGAMYSQRFDGGVSLDFAAHSGLKTSASSNYAIRSGRQKTAKASARDIAYSLRAKYTGVPGLEIGGTIQHQVNITQSADPTAGAATLLEAHASWQTGPFALRALYATWDLDGTGPASVGADEQTGWFIEPSYKFNKEVGVFARYNQWDNRAGDATDSEYSQVDVGLNYWPHPDVVLKIDYQDQDAPGTSSEFDGINLGVGYQF